MLRNIAQSAVLLTLVFPALVRAQQATPPPAKLPASATDTSTEELRQQLRELQERVDALAQAQEKNSAPPAGAARTHLGGYGELHYNRLDSGNVLDLHRVVFLVGHDFTDRVRFNSEIEFEHALIENVAGASKGGAVEIEQAYLEFDVGAVSKARAGLLLVPVGIVNETHEPPAFYGVERNPVESNIIPSTWRETGAMLSSPFGDSGVSLDLAVHSGLKFDVTTAPAPTERFVIHEGLQEGVEASANAGAATARVKFTGVPGLELAATGQYQQDVAQRTGPEKMPAWLYEAHAIGHIGTVDLRALYARFQIDSTLAELDMRDVQSGYYGEASWRVVPAFGFFARYSVWDNGGAATGTEIRQVNGGFNYWPIENVVLKADAQMQDGAGMDDGVSFGVGWQF